MKVRFLQRPARYQSEPEDHSRAVAICLEADRPHCPEAGERSARRALRTAQHCCEFRPEASSAKSCLAASNSSQGLRLKAIERRGRLGPKIRARASICWL